MPKYYGTLNSEYNKNERLFAKVRKCRNFDDVHYMHFTAKGKPWSYTQKTTEAMYRANYEAKVYRVLKEWINSTRNHCPHLID